MAMSGVGYMGAFVLYGMSGKWNTENPDGPATWDLTASACVEFFESPSNLILLISIAAIGIA